MADRIREQITPGRKRLPPLRVVPADLEKECSKLSIDRLGHRPCPRSLRNKPVPVAQKARSHMARRTSIVLAIRTEIRLPRPIRQQLLLQPSVPLVLLELLGLYVGAAIAMLAVGPGRFAIDELILRRFDPDVRSQADRLEAAFASTERATADSSSTIVPDGVS